MVGPIDTSFDFATDTPPGKDPDALSPTLRRYHRMLWSKPLPSGEIFDLDPTVRGEYLVHRSSRGEFRLTSDAITTNLVHKAGRVIQQIAPEVRPADLGYTMGSAILFPGVRINGKQNLNGARGFHPSIADRFDLTLECIRRHYAGEDNKLADVLQRYSDFFGLFGDFSGYVDFWLLQDLVEDDGATIRFFHHFDDFRTPAVPRTVDDYIAYVEASNDFIRRRNRRIDDFVRGMA
ncbi:DUF6994 family protein [Georgenia alba]|uniref:DUF6994 family protein n=1 Tax=Georgenia alba TaxID=2233858 RepID=A0ABW2Q5V8_9MICO